MLQHLEAADRASELLPQLDIVERGVERRAARPRARRRRRASGIPASARRAVAPRRRSQSGALPARGPRRRRAGSMTEPSTLRLAVAVMPRHRRAARGTRRLRAGTRSRPETHPPIAEGDERNVPSSRPALCVKRTPTRGRRHSARRLPSVAGTIRRAPASRSARATGACAVRCGHRHRPCGCGRLDQRHLQELLAGLLHDEREIEDAQAAAAVLLRDDGREPTGARSARATLPRPSRRRRPAARAGASGRRDRRTGARPSRRAGSAVRSAASPRHSTFCASARQAEHALGDDVALDFDRAAADRDAAHLEHVGGRVHHVIADCHVVDQRTEARRPRRPATPTRAGPARRRRS